MNDNNQNNNNKYYRQNSNTTSPIKLSDELLEIFKDEIDSHCLSINNIQAMTFEYLLDVHNQWSDTQDIFQQKSDLVNQILLRLSISGYYICGYGIINIINNEGYGFIRSEKNGYISSNDNVFAPTKIINIYGLRDGDHVRYTTRIFHSQEKRVSVHEITHIHWYKAYDDIVRKRRLFNEIIPEYPNERLKLSDGSASTIYANKNTLRTIDLFCPIGKGQRGLIVAPPKSGKTTILHDVAEAISKNNKDIIVIMLLVSERPEEITETKYRLGKKIQVFYADFSETPIKHIQITYLCINYAKRLLELGKDVVIFLDSATRLARSYNATVTNSGRSLSGGVDASALYQMKTIFGAARNSKQGSITILATCLVDTGSKMDEIIYEELKGTGNMELLLNRSIAEKGIFPAIDIQRSSTRRIDLLYTQHKVSVIYKIREFLQNVKSNDAIRIMISKFEETKDNNELLEKAMGTKNYNN